MSSPFQQFKARTEIRAHDVRHRQIVQSALANYTSARNQTRAAFQDYPAARQAAAVTKWNAINHLDTYLQQFVSKLEDRGTQVHWAGTGAEACQIILEVIRRKKAHSVIKSKTMTSEEIHLNEALQREGLEVVESDLGEFIVQLRKEAPYHIVFPAMHLTRGEIRDLFNRELGANSSDDPEELTMVARRVLRERYLSADIGLTGANFAIAETGMISLTENEGNARLTTALPRTMITLLGIEKVLPRMEDLALFLPMLAASGTGQFLTCYNSLYAGPRQAGEADGPQEWHVVLLDNGRTQILADPEQRDALHCIRCGACLNVCPVFSHVGGDSYGTTYSGPIGSVITPHLRGMQDWAHLSFASSLCGACTDTCPVKIDLAHHLLQNRRNATAQRPSLAWSLAFKLFAFIFNWPALYRLVPPLGRFAQRLHVLVDATPLDPARAWTKTRKLPKIGRQTFKEFWKTRL